MLHRLIASFRILHISGWPSFRDDPHGPYRLPRLIEGCSVSDLRANSRSDVFQTAPARFETELQYSSMLVQDFCNSLQVFLPDCTVRDRHGLQCSVQPHDLSGKVVD